MLYSIDDVVVLGKAATLSVEELHEYLDIFGNPVPMGQVIEENTVLKNRDRTVVKIADQIRRNMELGKDILALWREYVICTRVHGLAIEQLQAFSLVQSALLAGCLSEAADLIPNLPEDALVVTPEIKAKFSAACDSADHIDTHIPE